MSEIYFCTPGELVIYLASNGPSPWDGQLCRVLGIKKGRLDIELVGQHIPKGHARHMLSPKDIIDCSEINEEEEDEEEEEDGEGDDHDDVKWSDADMDKFLDSVISSLSAKTTVVDDPPSCDEIIWNSSNTIWKDMVSQGQSLVLSCEEQIALEMFNQSISKVSTRKEYLVSLLLTMQSARKLNNFQLLLQCFEQYSVNNPADIQTQVQMYKVLWESPTIAESVMHQIEMGLRHFVNLFPCSPLVLLNFGYFEKFRGNQNSFHASIRKCCYECPLQSPVEANAHVAIETYTQIGWSALEFVEMDPWMPIRAFIRAFNVARNNGLDPCNPRSTRSNKYQDERLRETVSKCLYDYALVSKHLSDHFKKSNRPNSCLNSAFSALTLCCDIERNNHLYRQAKEECAKLISPSI